MFEHPSERFQRRGVVRPQFVGWWGGGVAEVAVMTVFDDCRGQISHHLKRLHHHRRAPGDSKPSDFQQQISGWDSLAVLVRFFEAVALVCEEEMCPSWQMVSSTSLHHRLVAPRAPR